MLTASTTVANYTISLDEGVLTIRHEPTGSTITAPGTVTRTAYEETVWSFDRAAAVGAETALFADLATR